MNTAQSIAWIKQRLGDVCEDVPVQGDRPLLLDDPSCAYLTLSEHHQVFCVGYENGQATGRREHVAICEPGQLLFGLEPPQTQGAAALVLSGVTGSVVWRIPTARLFQLLEDPEGLQVVAGLFDSWIQLLTDTLPSAPVPTKAQSISVGEVLPADPALANVMALKARDGLVWVAPDQMAWYRGMDVTGILPVNCWPLTDEAWGLRDGKELRGWGTTELLAANRSAVFADRFYAFVIGVVAARRAGLATGRLDRDRVSKDAEQRRIQDSLAKLALVGSGRRLEADFGSGDGLQRACRMICHSMGIERPYIPETRGSRLSDMQATLSRATGVRTRSVLLEGDWRQHDNGPLLGFLVEEASEPDPAETRMDSIRPSLTGVEDALHPIALVRERGGYVVLDPRDGSRRPVSKRVAQELHPQAYQFYAPMPKQALGPFDVLRFASQGARKDVAFVVAVGLATGSVSTLIPLLTGQVFDRIIPGAESGLLRDLTLVLIGVYGALLLFDIARGFVMVRAQMRMDATLEAGVWDRMLNLPLPFFRQYSAGDLAQRAAGIGGIREVLAGSTLTVMLGGLFSVWNLGLLFYIDVRLALASTGLVLIAAVVAAIAAYYALQRERVVATLDGKIGGLILQLFGGVAKLRVSGAEQRAFSVWAQLFSQRRDADLGAERVNTRASVFQGAFPILTSMTLFWLLAGSGKQSLTTGQFLAFSAAFSMFLAAVLDVIHTGLQSLRVIPMYERAKPILAEQVESQGRDEGKVELRGSVEVSHVSFRYETDGPLILDDVDLRIEPNEFVAIVGASGSGKSTLLRILLGFEKPTEGGVFYDGQALVGMDVRQVRQQIGVVLQNSRVTPGDIYSNISGNRGISHDDAWAAAKQAAFDKDIEAMPMGMHTVVDAGGGTLSGGQRQRLLIARALASKPKVLFFDEATSALDNMTQAVVSESLEQLRVTRVVIAHRLSTIQHADKIIVLERGRIVQQGRFSELMEQEGTFRNLAIRQTV